jgi:Tol biopolymer transport system component
VITLSGITIGAQDNRQAEAALQRAMNKEFIDGNIEGAIKDYKEIASTYKSNSVIAAKALLRLGQAYERLGDTEAQKAYYRLINDYRDQRETVAEAQVRLAAIAPSPSKDVPAFKGLERLVTNSTFDWEAITPDGRYLVSGQYGFALRDVVSGEEKEIGENEIKVSGGWADKIAVSRDGKRVAYAWELLGGPDSNQYELRVFPLDGSKDARPRVLLHNEEFRYNEPFGWSADNKEIYAILTRQDDTHLIVAVSAENGSMRTLKSLEWRWPDRLSVSPDGRYIAYDAPLERESRNRDIFVLSTNGSGEERVVQMETAYDASPIWTPDGSAIVFSSDRSGTHELWITQISEGKRRGPVVVLSRDKGIPKDGVIEPLGFGPDGSLFFRSQPIPTRDIHTAAIDFESGAVSRPFTQTVDRFAGRNSNPVYSPDGKSFAYFSEKNPLSGHLSIVIRTLASGEERDIPTTFVGQPLGGAAWFPDGQSLIFVGARPGETKALHRIDLNTGKEMMRRVVKADWSSPVVVSPDGKKVYFKRHAFGQGGDQILVAYDFATERETELYKGPLAGRVGPQKNVLSLSPDGERIAFAGAGNADNQVLRIVPTSGGEHQLVRSASADRLVPLKWSEDAKNVLIQRGNGQLWWVPVDGERGDGRRIGSGNYPFIESLHPDGKQVALTQRAEGARAATWKEPDFLRPRNIGCGITTCSGQSEDLYVATIDPRSERVRGSAVRLTRNPLTWDQSPVLSPDGKFIAFKRGRYIYDLVVRSLETGAERVYPTISPDQWESSLQATTVLRGDDLNVTSWHSWFHDGKSLLLVGVGSARAAYRLDLSSGRFTEIPGVPFQPFVISPDDKTLYTLTRESDTGQVSVLAFDLGAGKESKTSKTPINGFISRVFANDPTRRFGAALSLSPDGRTLAFYHAVGTNNEWRLARVAVDGTGYRELDSSVGATSKLLVWTRDGRNILFGQYNAAGNVARIMRIPAAGGKAEFTGLAINGDSWYTIGLTPDNARIVFSANIPSISTANVN